MRKIALSTVALTSLVAVSACSESPASQDAPAETAAGADGAVEAPMEPEAEPAAELTFADLTGDAAAGESIYYQCRACHMVEEGKNGVGPSLYGVIGSTAGSVDGFNYSDANANSGLTWTPEIMFEYLESPREYLPGTRMVYPGLKDAQDRADLIAYLGTIGE